MSQHVLIFYRECTGNLRLTERKISTNEREQKPERDGYEEHRVTSHEREDLQMTEPDMTLLGETGHFSA